jgi:hypothetical protein
VFGMVERGGRVKTHHMPEVTRRNVLDKLQDEISISAVAH